jgi:hypothetical protein
MFPLMAKKQTTDNASWPYAEELLEHGDPAFVAEVRRLTDANRLGELAPRWYADTRPAVRQLLFDYLDLPLNAFRHEALVKRLFKLAWQANDDEVMARFLVLFDRSVRREVKRRRRYQSVKAKSKEAALALAQEWRAEGADSVWFVGSSGLFGVRQAVPAAEPTAGANLRDIDSVHRQWTEEALASPPGTTMWRPPGTERKERWHRPAGSHPISEAQRQQLAKHRLFSLPTRRYLRRRAWRYFRLLGKNHPERYVPAMSIALKCYRDEDVADGLALLDNWGLVHALFHHSPVLQSDPRGWRPAPGRSLRELESAPIYEPLWLANPRALLDLVREGRCRPVRQWALHLIRRDHGAILRNLPPEELFAWLRHPDPLLVLAAVEVLRDFPDLASFGVDRLLHLVEEPNPETIESICELLTRLSPDHITLAQAAWLTAQRPLPVARLGLSWLRTKAPTNAEDYQALLSLVDAEAIPLRPEIVRHVRGVLGAVANFPVDWVLEFLDSRHADVRAEGWRWLITEPRAADNAGVWQKLLESPYDDVRLPLIEVLEALVADQNPPSLEGGPVDTGLVRLLWATVLLNAHRGGRRKPLVVGQVVRRLLRHPAEAAVLLPILAAALRSVRGPEWRAGLAGLVQAVRQNPDLRPLVESIFPELKFGV